MPVCFLRREIAALEDKQPGDVVWQGSAGVKTMWENSVRAGWQLDKHLVNKNLDVLHFAWYAEEVEMQAQ